MVIIDVSKPNEEIVKVCHMKKKMKAMKFKIALRKVPNTCNWVELHKIQKNIQIEGVYNHKEMGKNRKKLQVQSSCKKLLEDSRDQHGWSHFSKP